jgi:hypothetical protein
MFINRYNNNIIILFIPSIAYSARIVDGRLSTVGSSPLLPMQNSSRTMSTEERNEGNRAANLLPYSAQAMESAPV